MTAPLRALLDELAHDLAGTPSVPAHAAWAAGRRRRRAARVQAAAAVVVGALLLGLLVPLVGARPPGAFAGARADGVDGFPVRIGRQWWVRDLPDRPGPLAGLVQGRYDDDEQRQRWYGLAPDGRRWLLPDVAHRTDQYPTLSPDGRLLGYLETPDGPYVLHDLVTGERRRVADVGDNREVTRARHQLGGQVPSHWSPDGSRLLLPALEPVVLDVATGALTPVRRAGTAAGWAGPDRLVWLAEQHGADSSAPPLRTDVVVTDARGRELRRVELRTGEPPAVSQWTGVPSPDGTSVALLPDGSTPAAAVLIVDLATGLVPVVAPAPDAGGAVCSGTWGERLLVPVPAADSGSGPVSLDLDAPRLQAGVVAEDRGDVGCVLWARDALAEPRGGLLAGTSTAWWTWWWPELLAGALSLVLARYGWVRWRRGRVDGLRPRRRPRPDPPGTDWYG